MSDAPIAAHVIFRKLLSMTDDMRRSCFHSANRPQQKKLLNLTMRQGVAVGQLKMMMEDCPQGVALKTLASHLQMTVPATSLLVETMVSKGVFERNPNPDDRRAVCIRLSEKGNALVEELGAYIDSEVDQLARDLKPEDLQTLGRVVDQLCGLYYARGKK